MTLRGILLLAMGLAAGVAARGAGTGTMAGPPLQPRFDPTGKFAHGPDVAVRFVSISPTEVILECSQGETASHPAAAWRERYAIKDGKIFLAAIGTAREVPAQPEHEEWQETTITQTAPPPAPPPNDPARAASPPETASLGVGPAAMDPHWSAYGKYLARLIAAIQGEWDRTRIAGKLYSRSGSRVAVGFIINSKGEIAQVTNVDSPPGMPEEYIHACVAAVTARAPYGEWPQDMALALGASQPLTFTFYYP